MTTARQEKIDKLKALELELEAQLSITYDHGHSTKLQRTLTRVKMQRFELEADEITGTTTI